MSEPLHLVINLNPMPEGWPDRFVVGLQSGKTDLVSGVEGDGGLCLEATVTVRPDKEGAPDFFGKLVHGKRRERFLYVWWGLLGSDTVKPYRRLKLYLGPLTRASWAQGGIIWPLIESGAPLSVTLSAVGDDGGPRCATAPALWTTAAGT